MNRPCTFPIQFTGPYGARLDLAGPHCVHGLDHPIDFAIPAARFSGSRPALPRETSG